MPKIGPICDKVCPFSYWKFAIVHRQNDWRSELQEQNNIFAILSLIGLCRLHNGISLYLPKDRSTKQSWIGTQSKRSLSPAVHRFPLWENFLLTMSERVFSPGFLPMFSRRNWSWGQWQVGTYFAEILNLTWRFKFFFQLQKPFGSIKQEIQRKDDSL